MAAPLILYLDTTRKVLLSNFLTTVGLGAIPQLEAGDNLPIQLHFLQQNTASQTPGALPYSYIDPATVTPVSLAVGSIGLAPTAGTFTVTWNASTSAALAYNISAAALQTVINALPGIPAGGVTVVGNAGGPYTVTFVTAGTQAHELVIDASDLVPVSIGLTAIAIAGATAVQEQEVLTLLQSPAALQNSWTATYGAIAVSRLQAGGAGLNEIQRISVPAATYGGAYSLAFGAKGTGALAYNITASALQTALAALSTIGANNVNVVQSSTTSWDVTFVGSLAGSGQSLMTASGAGLLMPQYLAASLNLNVQGIFNLLAGLSSVSATLQIQQGTAGNINTVVQASVTVNAALIRGTPSVPNPADPWQTLSQVNALIAAAAYVLQAATTSVIGGVIVPAAGRLLVDGSGNISAALGSASTFGVVKVDNTTIQAAAGVLSVISTYALPAATTTTLGGVIVPAAGRLSVDGSGNISVALGDAAVLGVVSVPSANGLSVTAGVIAMAQATAGSLGTVQPDGTIITVAAGLITVPQATAGAFGVVKVDGTTITAAGGVITAANGSSSASPTAKVGLAVVNGSSSSFMRADAAPPIDLTMAPTWTGSHTFGNVTNTFGSGGVGAVNAIVVINSGSGSGASPTVQFNSNSTQRAQILLGTATGVSGPAANDLCVMAIGANLVWVISNSVAFGSFSSTVMAIKPTTAANSTGLGALTNAGGMSTAGSTRCQVGTSTVYAAAGGTLFEHFTGVSNSTTTETVLFSDTLSANSLTTNGDMLRLSYGLTTLAHASATREIKFYFGATVLFDSTAQTTVSAGTAILEILLIRQSSTVLVYKIQFMCPQMPTPTILNVGTLTAQSFTGTNLLKITGQSTNTTGDITALTGRITYHPAV